MSIFDIFDKIKSKDEEKQSGKIEYLIVGLGNPGLKYENTRHNAGFMAIDNIADKLNITVDRVKFKSVVKNVNIDDKKCLLMKPTTYMNLSGEAVLEAMNFYKIPIENVIVFYDDISLEPGLVRLRRKGSHGGHNGIKNIIELTGKDTFPRVKIGVGKKPHPDYDLADWVLSKLTDNDKENLQKVLDNCLEISSFLVNNNIDKAMNKFNS